MMTLEEIPWFAEADRGRRWLVGVSGGADSVALLRLLVEAGFVDLVVCHLNHGLRGDESDGDEDFVRDLAAELGLSCEMGRTDLRRRMNRSGESLETAARHERHAFFAACSEKRDCGSVLLAHHADDQAETVLWNLLRGSYGMRGMRGCRHILTDAGVVLEIVRPLLGVRRAALVRWLVDRNFNWREDASNAEPIAVRNRLRNEALPLLNEISGRDAVAALAKTAGDARESEELVAWALERAAVLDPQGRLHAPVLRSLPVALRRAAFVRFLAGAGVPDITTALLARLLAQLEAGGPPAVSLPGGFRMRRRGGRMFLESESQKEKKNS